MRLRIECRLVRPHSICIATKRQSSDDVYKRQRHSHRFLSRVQFLVKRWSSIRAEISCRCTGNVLHLLLGWGALFTLAWNVLSSSPRAASASGLKAFACMHDVYTLFEAQALRPGIPCAYFTASELLCISVLGSLKRTAS